MNPTVPKNMIAVSKDGDHVMGFYAMFTVPDRFVSASKLNRAWASEGLPMGLVPTNRKAVDTFKNACRSVETRRHGAGRTVEVKVDQVTETYDDCVYQVTHMVRDKTQRQIDHPKALKVTFDKHAQTIAYEMLSSKYASQLHEIQEAITANYDANTSKVPGSKVRAAIRGLMDHLHATNVRRKSGGVYFVPVQGRDDLDGLTRVLDFLYSDDAEVHLIPCANDEYQKDMVQRHFELNVSTEIDEAISKIADKLQSSRKVRSDALGNFFVKRKELGELRAKYTDMIGSELETVNEKLSLMDEQLNALMEQATAAP